MRWRGKMSSFPFNRSLGAKFSSANYWKHSPPSAGMPDAASKLLGEVAGKAAHCSDNPDTSGETKTQTYL